MSLYRATADGLLVTPSVPSPPDGRFGATEFVLLASASLVWGVAYVLIRQGIEAGATPLAYAGVRYALSAAGFAVLAAVGRRPLPGRRQLAVSALLGGTLIVGLYGGFLYWGEQFTTGGYAALLASTLPLLTVAFGLVFLASDRLGARGLAGMAVGFVGAALLVVPELTSGAFGSWQGPAFVVAAMACASSGTVLLRRYGGGPQSLWQLAAQFGAAAGVLGIGTAVVPGREALPWTVPVIEDLVVLVVFSSILGYFAYFALHHRVGPIRANVVAYLVPLVGVAIGSGLYGEPLTGWEVGGVAVVFVGVSLVLWETSRAAPRPAGEGPRDPS